jgi:hypothetical protein
MSLYDYTGAAVAIYAAIVIVWAVRTLWTLCNE